MDDGEQTETTASHMDIVLNEQGETFLPTWAVVDLLRSVAIVMRGNEDDPDVSIGMFARILDRNADALEVRAIEATTQAGEPMA
ncbi:hypothetical protein [Streptomyces qinglanensis]|uniref:Uncharacterized protein n=1 Tax=Streptomyces qinglanensis TaxID=943816 RepID=A0A1H9U418_9ACTN|nr:hypothetical protein [Streptomyces qinglanensis]SES03907.1 hypothetical protein SAMN05421870_107284 [Streptomyces qinglanensis]